MDVDQRIVDQAGIASEQVFLGDHDVEVERGPAKGVHQVGNRLAGDVPVSGVHELGDPKRTALGWLGLQVVHFAERELVGRHFAPGRVVDHVFGDLDRFDHRQVLRAALALVPVAREVTRRIDDDGAAAVLDAPERDSSGTEQVLAAPDRMVLRKRTKLVALFRERSPS